MSIFKNVYGTWHYESPLTSNLQKTVCKILFTDASSSCDSSFSSVLAQVTKPNDPNTIPQHINLDDKVQRIIWDYKLTCRHLSLPYPQEEDKSLLHTSFQNFPTWIQIFIRWIPWIFTRNYQSITHYFSKSTSENT